MMKNFKQKLHNFLLNLFGFAEKINNLESQVESLQAEKVDLEARVVKLQDKCNDMEDKLDDPTEYLRKLMDNEYPWFDYKELEDEKRENYLKTVETLRRNQAFKNEINKFIATSAKEALYETNDYNDLLCLRSSVTTMKSFKKHIINDVPKPGTKKNQEPENPHAPI